MLGLFRKKNKNSEYIHDNIMIDKKSSAEISNQTVEFIDNDEEDLDEIFKKKYKIHEQLGKGSFGTVYRATDKHKFEYAIKYESLKDTKKHLLRENRIYDSIKDKTFQYDFPRKYYYGEHSKERVLVLQKLGKSLKYYNKKYHFDLETCSNIAVQILYRLENLHSLGWLHQDIKPENILVDSVKGRKLFLADFGTSGRWATIDIDHNILQHVSYKRTNRIVGTARYSSINNHRGFTQSRRDDLESFGYVLLYFILGKLPWQGINSNSIRSKWDTIMNKKKTTDIIGLCHHEDLDVCFSQYFQYISKLDFDEKPDYKFLRKLFRKNIKKDFFWSRMKLN